MTHALAAKELWARAQSGTKLSTQERRHVVEWLTVMGEISNHTNTDLAKIFGLTERALRLDKKKIREDAVKALAENKDINFVIADVFQDFESQRRDLERNKKHARAGSATYNQACKMVFDMRVQMLKLLQDLGWLPKNLGTATTESYIHKAIVNVKDGSVSTETIHDVTTSRSMIKQINDNEANAAVQYQYKALIQSPVEDSIINVPDRSTATSS